MDKNVQKLDNGQNGHLAQNLVEVDLGKRPEIVLNLTLTAQTLTILAKQY